MDPADQVTGIAPRMDRHFHLGAAVHSLDGRAGTLHGLVVDRAVLAVTHLIIHRIRSRRALLMVPMTRVVVPMGERVVLGLTSGELRAAPPLREDVLQMSRASLVECEGQLLGILDCVLMDPRTQRVTYLVVRKGVLIGYNLLVPVGSIRAILGHQISLGTSRADLAHLERFPTHRNTAQHAFTL